MYCNTDSESDLLSSKFVQTVHKRLECAVCKDKYSSQKIPRRLDCDHSFCEGCLERVEEYNRIKCPTCRDVTRLPLQGVTGLKKNLDLLGLIDDVAEAAAKKPQFALCETHQKHMELFCKTDKKPVCTLCIHTMEHKGHEYYTLLEHIEYLIKEAERQFSKFEEQENDISEADIRLRQLQSASQSLKKQSLQKMGAEQNMVMRFIAWKYDQLMRKIEESNDEVSAICETKMERNNLESHYIDDKKKELKSVKELAKIQLDEAVPALDQFIAEVGKKEITVQERSDEDEKKVLTFNYSSDEVIPSPVMQPNKKGSSENELIGYTAKHARADDKGSADYCVAMYDSSVQGKPAIDKELSSIVKMIVPFIKTNKKDY